MKNLFKVLCLGLRIVFSCSILLISCAKDSHSVVNKYVTDANNNECNDRSDVCLCPSGGCNGPATLRLEILERVHEPSIDLYLKWLCGESNNQTTCYTWNNPSVGAIIDIPIGYASNTGGQIPLGVFTPHYNLESLFYFPPASNSKIKVKITGPNINQIVIFNTVLAPPPQVFSLNLYPWQWCI